MSGGSSVRNLPMLVSVVFLTGTPLLPSYWYFKKGLLCPNMTQQTVLSQFCLKVVFIHEGHLSGVVPMTRNFFMKLCYMQF